jgi:hypothetical protein
MLPIFVHDSNKEYGVVLSSVVREKGTKGDPGRDRFDVKGSM